MEKMFRYVTLNSISNTNPQPLSKKNPKTVPISLLSGGNSFFVKIKSNQIASNYHDTSNKIKPNSLQKISNINYHNDNKNKSYNKCLNNSQHKNSYVFAVNNSIEYNNKITKKSLVNKSKQDLFNHNKGIYSFTSMKHNDNINNKTINSTSSRQNYNGVLITDVELLKKNMNKNFNIFEEKQDNKKIIKNKNVKNINNALKCKFIGKEINLKNKANKIEISESSLNKKKKALTDKNAILTTINKNSNNNNQMKLYKKNNNQYIIKNNAKNFLKAKNLTNILFNNSVIEKSKQKNGYKNNFSERKNKLIYHGAKKNKILCCKELGNNNNTNIFKEHFIDTDEFNSSVSKKKIEKRIKSIRTKPNNECLRIDKNNNNKSNFNTINNNKSLVVQQKFCDKNKSQHIINKSNNLNNKNAKLINNLGSRDIFKINYTLTDLIGTNSNSYKSRMNKPIYHNDNKQKDFKIGNNYLLSDLNTHNINRNNNFGNYPNIIINNNYLYNYMPFVTLNNSVDDDNIKRLSLNRNSFIENKVEKSNISINSSQNFKIDRGQTYILNYSSLFDSNSKNLNNCNISKENKSKINQKYKNEQQMKINKIENHIKNNYINNKNNNNILNCNPKNLSSSTLDNINKTNNRELNIFQNKVKPNIIAESYVSKEKIKKQKQNPPLSKNPKKLNILSLIQENNRKIKDSNSRRQHQFSSFVETDNFNKCYNNKNVYETIDYILYPDNYKIKDSIDVLDNFDDMNTIIKRLNFDNIDIKNVNIFTVNDNNNNISSHKGFDNYFYTKFSESFDKIFDKKFKNRNHMSATQNKIKKNNNNNNNLYHSRQSGSTKDSNKENSSIKKYRVLSYLENKYEKK